MTCIGQSDEPRPIDGRIFTFGVGLGYFIPSGQLAQRYGTTLQFSVNAEYISSSSIVITPEFHYFFGDNVKEDVLFPFRTQEGYLLGDDNQIADVFIRQRGLFLGINAGKIFRFSEKSRTGLKTTIGLGIFQHGMRFVDDRNALAQLRIGRRVGYDRLTRGFALKESIGYKILSANKRINIEFAFDCIQGFTDEVRAVNFDTGLPTLKSRFDMTFGFKILWSLPFYSSVESIVYY